MSHIILGHKESAEQDSFSNGLLDCPHYTRPEVLTKFNDLARVFLVNLNIKNKNWVVCYTGGSKE